MKPLHELPNIGKTLEQKLIEVGITTPKMLMEKGSNETFGLIREKDKTACLNMLYALEGAIKDKLKEYYLSL